MPCPGVTPRSRICPLLKSHGLLGKKRVLTYTHSPPPHPPGMEQLKGCPAACVSGEESILAWMRLERQLSLSPPDPSWGGAHGGLGKWAWLGCQELEAGARPAPLPGSLGPISSGCFQAGSAQGRGSRNREPVSRQRFKGLSS